MMFEQVGDIDENGYWRLRKLAPRMPRTISEINVERDGGLKNIRQYTTTPLDDKGVIPVDRLVAYVWEKEGANWIGQSVLRPMYRNWFIKDVLIRIDAMKHERNGLGIPIGKAAKGSGSRQLRELSAMAQAMKAGESAGGAVPPGADIELKGVSGSLTNVIESIRYHDQQMSKVLLMMFVSLGQDGVGSYSLGESMVDFFDVAQQTLATFIADTFTAHVIEDWVSWNFGDDEPAPRLVFEKDEDPELAVADLAAMVERGVITVDPELESWFRIAHNIPPKTETEESAPSGQSFAYDLESGIITIDERRAQMGLEPRPDGLGKLTVPEFLAQFGGTADGAVEGGDEDDQDPPQSDPPDGDGAPPPPPPPTSAGADLASTWKRAVEERPSWRERMRRRLGGEPRAELPAHMLPDRELRRRPYAHEVAAQVDFKELDDAWQETVDDLVSTWRDDVQAAHLDEIVDQIDDASGDLVKLAEITASVKGVDVLADAMLKTVDDGIDAAIAEAKRQGVTIRRPDAAAVAAGVEERAEATAAVLARSVSEVSARKAVSFSAGGALSAREVAASVREHVESLSDAFLVENIGGAVTHAQNEGRALVISEGPASRVYASELLDNNTCGPCTDIDGTEYDSVDDAAADYPGGGFKECEGGDRCRGTLVAVYGEEDATS